MEFSVEETLIDVSISTPFLLQPCKFCSFSELHGGVSDLVVIVLNSFTDSPLQESLTLGQILLKTCLTGTNSALTGPERVKMVGKQCFEHNTEI